VHPFWKTSATAAISVWLTGSAKAGAGDHITYAGYAIQAWGMAAKDVAVKEARDQVGGVVGIVGDTVNFGQALEQGKMETAKELTKIGVKLIIYAGTEGAAIPAKIAVDFGVDQAVDAVFDQYETGKRIQQYDAFADSLDRQQDARTDAKIQEKIDQREAAAYQSWFEAKIAGIRNPNNFGGLAGQPEASDPNADPCSDMDWYENKCEKSGQPDAQAQPSGSGWREVSEVRSDGLTRNLSNECVDQGGIGLDGMAESYRISYASTPNCQGSTSMINQYNAVVSYRCVRDNDNNSYGFGSIEIYMKDDQQRVIVKEHNDQTGENLVIENHFQRCALSAP